jgi:hypothetical protein
MFSFLFAVNAAISTTFHGQEFYVPRAGSFEDDQDMASAETLRIFSTLTELIALQTTDDATASLPIVV